VNNLAPKDRQTPSQSPTPEAAGTFTFYRDTALANAPMAGGVTVRSSTTNEPSLGSIGRVVFWTQNWYAAVSGDYGRTFGYINPYDNFPADGANDNVNGGFCCDQIAYYERTRGLMFWLVQYNRDSTSNTQRLAVARSQEDIVNNNWITYDFTPATFGYTAPPGQTGVWLDFPDLTVSDSYLYLTTNVFDTNTPNPNFLGSVVARMGLNDLAAGTPNLGLNFYTDRTGSYRCVQGAHPTMYWGTHLSSTQIRIYRWAEFSNNVLWDDVNHGAYNVGCPMGCTTAMTATGPDSTNFAGNADDRILGAWAARGVIGFMWNGAQGGSFSYPHVWVARFQESDRMHIDDGQVFNNSYAYLYPSVQVNDRGHLGGTMAWGGGTQFPNTLAWIADDFNNHTITPLENSAFTAGTAGPASNRWGDFLSTRINIPYGTTWIGSGYELIGGTGNVNAVPHFVWFGRERDTPPASNTIYVDKANTSRFQDGSAAHPYNTVAKGHFAATPGDTLVIRAGNYPETLQMNKRLTVGSQGGTVKVGAP
jgi:hypothetical protein